MYVQRNNCTRENEGVIDLYAVWVPDYKLEANLKPTTSYIDYRLLDVTTEIDVPSEIIIAIYKNNELVRVETRPCLLSTETFVIYDDFDTIKVMLWKSLDSLSPRTSAKNVVQ